MSSTDLSGVKIRLAGIDDLAGIFHLGEKIFTSQVVANLYRTWDEYEVTHLFNSDPEYMVVADDEGEVVGFALGTTIQKTRSAWYYGHLLWLGVHPDYSRQGLGGMLFDRFKLIMKKAGVRLLLVDTQADNEEALAFFQNRGFLNPIDHVYMTLNLEN